MSKDSELIAERPSGFPRSSSNPSPYAWLLLHTLPFARVAEHVPD